MKSEANKVDLSSFYLSVNPVNSILYILTALLSLFAFGCKNSQSAHSDLVEAEFSVDSTLLENEAFRDSAINLDIKIPLHWSSVDSATIQKLESGILAGDYKNALLLRALMNQNDSSLMIILDVTAMDHLFFEALKSNYEKLLNPNKNWNHVQLSEFKLNCFRLQQYVLQSSEMLHFKLIGYEKRDLSDKAHFEIMYFINPRNYEKDIKFVESSIGSLNCLTFKK